MVHSALVGGQTVRLILDHTGLDHACRLFLQAFLGAEVPHPLDIDEYPPSEWC
jgi:hypothetical protein